jgi:transcriptional regulator with XRE-family HTH domain
MRAHARVQSEREIAVRLERLRLHLGYKTQGPFAELCGLGRTAYTQYEAGSRRLTLDAAVNICAATHVTLDWLFLGEIHGLPAMLKDLAKQPQTAA